MTASPRIVVMGVSGCGKSTVGRGLAQALGVAYVEGDELHPPENVARMRAGTALTDADRQGWLRAIGERLASPAAREHGMVVSCSALKRAYRDLLRQAAPGLRFVHLHGSPALLAARMAARTDHYMPPSLLQSQLDTLQMPGTDEHAITIDIALAPDAQVALAQASLRASADNPTMTTPNPRFTQVILFTDTDGRARFKEEPLALSEGKPMSRLSPLRASGGFQFRESPVGFRSEFHCTGDPQWLVILQGQMEIGLQDGTSRVFGPGDSFLSNDTLPAGATFDPAVHGHWSRQVGDVPLQTMFVRL